MLKLDNLMPPNKIFFVVTICGLKHVNYIYFFPIGIDLFDLMNLGQEVASHDDIARKSKVLRVFIKKYQDCLTAIEKVLLYFTNITILKITI